jgi:hypothetical protein
VTVKILIIEGLQLFVKVSAFVFTSIYIHKQPAVLPLAGGMRVNVTSL